MKSSSQVLLNGELIEEDQAAISPFNRGMMYGDGCFETLRSYSGKFLEWELHFDRLKAGLNYLEIDTPFTSEELKKHIQKVIKSNNFFESEALIRLQCWREGTRGYSTSSRKASWMIQASQISTQNNEVNLTLAETPCIPSEALERKYKLSNGLNYIKAAQEANKRSSDDALMLTVHEKISETTSSNIFWIKKDKVFTPSADCDLLPGVTRSIVISVIKLLGIPLQEGKFEIEALRKAEAIFCTNSLKEIVEVRGLDKLKFELDHPLTQKIKTGFEQFKLKELKG